MVTVDKATLARISKKGRQFEILVDPDLAVKARDTLRSGKDIDLSDILAVEDVFFDSRKGTRAGKKDLMPAFDTADIIKIAKIILKEGKIVETHEHMQKEMHEKFDRIVALISINAVDPKSKIPIPKKTIEDALRKAVFRVNDNKKVEDQLPDAIKAVSRILPVAFSNRTLQINNIPPSQATPCLNYCKNLGSIEKQTWNQDKSLTLVVKVPAGLREELMDKINALTHGNADIKIID